jgi:hypothetical protein
VARIFLRTIALPTKVQSARVRIPPNPNTNKHVAVPYSPLFTTMYQQGQIPPVFSIALSRPSPLRSNDGYIGLGGLPPVLAIGAWGTASIQYVAMNSPGGGYLPTTLPYPQHGS